jgi:hypothetical protein
MLKASTTESPLPTATGMPGSKPQSAAASGKSAPEMFCAEATVGKLRP